MPKHPGRELHDAKARFSQLFRRARTEGPVVLPAEDFDRASAKARQPDSLLEFFKSAPTGGRVLDLKRKSDKTRKIKFKW